jgi:molecular chaperone GrpE (heat shock protein)
MVEPSVEATPAAPEPDEPGEIRNDQDAIKAVEALLTAPSGAEEETPGDDAEPPTEEWDVSSLAEKLQAPPEKLYGLKVPMADGESRTLGELKDAYRTAEQVKAERETVQKERTTWQADKRQTLEELNEALSLLPAQAITPELVQRAQRQIQEHAQRELAATLELIPDWKDDLKRAADRAVMVEYLSGYGFSEADLDGLRNAKLMKLFRDASQAAKAAKVVKELPKPKVAQAPKRPGNRTAAQVHGQLKAAVTTRRISPLQAVEQLLKG